MTKEEIQATLQFLSRTQLTGNEVQAFARVVAALRNMLDELEAAETSKQAEMDLS